MNLCGRIQHLLSYRFRCERAHVHQLRYHLEVPHEQQRRQQHHTHRCSREFGETLRAALGKQYAVGLDRVPAAVSQERTRNLPHLSLDGERFFRDFLRVTATHEGNHRQPTL